MEIRESSCRYLSFIFQEIFNFTEEEIETRTKEKAYLGADFVQAQRIIDAIQRPLPGY